MADAGARAGGRTQYAADTRELLENIDINALGENAYPIAAFTYLLVYRDLSYLDTHKAHGLIHFPRWILTTGQQDAKILHDTPLPEALCDSALDDLATIVLPPLPEATADPSKETATELRH